MILFLIFIVILAAAMFIPHAVFIFLLVNLGIVVFLSVSQIIIALLPRFQPGSKKPEIWPFVSILVPAYNEPPAVLMQTLEKLSRLKYDNYEVLIIDNNTKDPDVWMPVKNFSLTLGDKFRFFHVDPLSGFKAGALNFAIERVNEKSEFVAVIDADYTVSHDFLETALAYFIVDKIALVQFPQFYRNSIDENRPVADEYRHFFGIYMNMANHFDCVPSTGTVSIYRLKALRNIGGFRKEALTEDADVGLRLYGAGYRGVYVDRPMGYGFMPYDLEAYRKQKWRWAYGNAQSIKMLFALSGKIPFKSWIGFFFHLTAWDHLNLLPFAVLGAYSVLLIPAVPITDLHRQLLSLASLSIFITSVSKFFLFLAALHGSKNLFSRAFKACIIHMGMTLIYSEAWLACLFGVKSVFERTNKFILAKMPSLLKNTSKELILGFWFLIGTVEAVFWGTRKISVFAFILSALVLFSIFYVYWKIMPTKFCSKKQIADLEEKFKLFLIDSPSQSNTKNS